MIPCLLPPNYGGVLHLAPHVVANPSLEELEAENRLLRQLLLEDQPDTWPERRELPDEDFVA